MASAIPPILIQIQADVAQLKAGMAQAEASVKGLDGSVKTASTGMSNMMDSAKKMAGTLGVAFAGTQVVKFAKDTIMAASSMNESISKVNVVFGDSADAVFKFGNAAAKNMGMSNQAAIEAAGTYGNLFQAFGIGQGKAKEMSTTLVQLAADLGSFNNTSTEEAINALRSGLSGETEPLKRFGVAINETTLKAKALEMGFGAIKGAMDPAMKAQVTYALVMEQTTLAQGDYARTANGTANTMKTLSAQFADAKVAIGDILLPAFNALLAVFQGVIPILKSLADFVKRNKDLFDALAIGVGVVTAAFLLYKGALFATTLASNLFAIAQVLMTGGQLAAIASTNTLAASMLRLNFIMRANPVGLIVTAVALLVAGFVLLYKKSETFRNLMNSIFAGLIGAIGQFVGAIATMVEGLSKIPGIGSKFDGAAKAIRGASDALKGFATGLTAVKQAQSTSNAALGLSGSAFDAIVKPKVKSGTTKTAAQIAENKKKKEALAKLYDDVQSTYDKMNGVISDSSEKRIKITAAYDDKVAKLKIDSGKRIAALESKALEDRNNAEIKASEDRISIIKKGQDMLRSAFLAGAAFDLAEMFKDSDKSGAGLVSKLKEKFVAINKLKSDAYKLAAAGYSQTFIQDIVKNGPEIGSQMAQAILGSSPETQAQLKDLFYGLEDVSKYGLDSLAKQMSTSTSFATQELMDEYNNVETELQKTFKTINSNLRVALDEEAVSLKDALIEAQKDFNTAITELEKDTMDKLATLQKELAKTAAQIAGMSGASASVSVMANSPAAPYVAGVTPLGVSTDAMTKRDLQLIVNQTNNVNGQTSAADIQSATVSAIKFGYAGSGLYSAGNKGSAGSLI